MKKINKSTTLGILTLLSMLVTSCYYRIGDLNVISNRNIESKVDYKLLKPYVVSTVKSKKGDPLEAVIDKAVKGVPGGEFMKNTKIFVKVNGKKIKVEGDVWGIPSVTSNVNQSVDADIKFEVGDTVSFKGAFGKIEEGTILGLNQTTAVVSCKNGFGKEVKKEIPYQELTKLGK